jgi:hypothetical protein
MPFKSKAQRRKFAQLLVEGKITDEQYEEWNRSTGRKELPERVGDKGAAKARTTTKRAAKKGTAKKRATTGARKSSVRKPLKKATPKRPARRKVAKSST